MASSRRRSEMAKKGHKPEEAVAKLRQVDVLVSQGRSVAEAVRAIGATEVTYYRWRRTFGGLRSDQVRRLKGAGAGGVAGAVRASGATEVTYYRWRRELGGLRSDQVKRLKELEAENARLRRAVADLTLDKQILAEAARGNFQAPRAGARAPRPSSPRRARPTP